MARPWYKRYPGDFIAGTVLLSFEQKGAYSMLLDLMYLRGGPVPDVPQEISRIMGLSVRKWKSIRQDLLDLEKIYELDGHIHNTRVDRELPENEKEAEKFRENGAKGGEKSPENGSKIRDKNAENKTETRKNNDLSKKGLPEKTKHTRASQRPDARDQKEGSQTTTTESNAGGTPDDRPPDGGDGLQADPFEIPEFLDRRGGAGPGADPGPVPGPGGGLRNKPPLAAQCEPDVPDPDDPDPVAAVKVAYLEAREAVFGTDWLASRPGMAGVDHQGHGTAMRWVEAGATPDLVRAVIETEMAKFKGRGKTYPPSAMHYFDNPISEAIAAAKRPMPTAGDTSGGEDFHPDAERNQWRGRIKGWVERDLWLDSWGPNPDEPRCEAPTDILAEFNLTQTKGAAQ